MGEEKYIDLDVLNSIFTTPKQAPLFDSYYEILGKNEYLPSFENKTIELIKEIKENPSNYSMASYNRKALSTYSPENSSLFTHSLFVLYNKDSNTVCTLSFNGTKDGLINSEGAWLVNTIADAISFDDFVYGRNDWSMKVINQFGTIDVEKTVSNILNKIISTEKYYLFDHKDDRQDVSNCVTALESAIMRK